jgi:hypothetical protein
MILPTDIIYKDPGIKREAKWIFTVRFRNAVLLTKECWTPGNWKLVNGWRMCLKYFFYSLFTRPRIEHWRIMTLEIRHGLLGRTGQYREA